MCLPQAQCTVSVGRGLVSCCLQTGQGFVITGVIILAPFIRSSARRVPSIRRFFEGRHPIARAVAPHVFLAAAQCTTARLGWRPNRHPGIAFSAEKYFVRYGSFTFFCQVNSSHTRPRITVFAVAQIFSVLAKTPTSSPSDVNRQQCDLADAGCNLQ